MATCDGNEIHIFYSKKRKDNLYIRTGNLNILEAKFHRVSVMFKDEIERDMLERYITRSVDPHQYLKLLDKGSVEIEDILRTDAMPDFEIEELDNGWWYSNLFNEEEIEKKWVFFKRKVYTTIIYNNNNKSKVLKSRTPITAQTVRELV